VLCSVRLLRGAEAPGDIGALDAVRGGSAGATGAAAVEAVARAAAEAVAACGAAPGRGLDEAAWVMASLGLAMASSADEDGEATPEEVWAHHPLGGALLDDVADALGRARLPHTTASLGRVLQPALTALEGTPWRAGDAAARGGGGSGGSAAAAMATACRWQAERLLLRGDWGLRAETARAAADLAGDPPEVVVGSGCLSVEAFTGAAPAAPGRPRPRAAARAAAPGEWPADVASLGAEDCQAVRRAAASGRLSCSVCSLPARGVVSVCPHCGHGGHWEHLRSWFAEQDECPSGCGCRCEGRFAEQA